jgi:hypothetical protein
VPVNHAILRKVPVKPFSSPRGDMQNKATQKLGATANATQGTMYTGAFTPSQASSVCSDDYNDTGYQLK